MMNNILEKFARYTLKNDLAKCTDSQRVMFKRMYAHGNEAQNINLVVDNMETEKLDWAMTQIQATLSKNVKVKKV